MFVPVLWELLTWTERKGRGESISSRVSPARVEILQVPLSKRGLGQMTYPRYSSVFPAVQWEGVMLSSGGHRPDGCISWCPQGSLGLHLLSE